jgi:creatinine amidohydrolase
MVGCESVWLEGLTWVEAEAVFGRFSVVLIPLGARVKEHGPHLPLNNDWLMAEYLAVRVAEEVPVVVLPTLQYGYYPSFLEYPGSVSVDWVTFKNFVKDVCRSVRGYGVNKFYVLNTGISTLKGLAPAAEELLEEGIIMRYTDIVKAESGVEGVLEQEGGTHADEGETSMMLYIKPEIVDMSKAVKDFHPLGGRGLTRDPDNTDAGVYSETGVYGDPTLATSEKGRILTENLIEAIKREILELIKF